MSNIAHWPERIRERYENYLKTSFFFKEPTLRDSFEAALREEGSLMKGPFPEPNRGFTTGLNARTFAQECFPDRGAGLTPALIDRSLYTHQESAIRAVYLQQRNVLVATGTASGKTESFLYPILFDLYRQHLAGELLDPGVRAMILYPMNALANDQRERLGAICQSLQRASTGFNPTFGQYIGQTPVYRRDTARNAALREDERLPGELVFREEMRTTPPHILLTNYSMLEYLLIRPDDSPLFDNDRGAHWQFIVLDEAHQYRGTKGMEMGMLIRRLKQRLRDGGQHGPFRCIATSATLSSGKTEQDRRAVAAFGKELFGEPFATNDVMFGQLSESQPVDADEHPRRYHAFLRALEGAFLIHRNGADEVVLNRVVDSNAHFNAHPMEIALCRECGQHYYVGRERNGRLMEAVRDPSHPDYGVQFYLPQESEDVGTHLLCRCCGALSKSDLTCDCGAPPLRVKKCDSHKDHPDQLSHCQVCGYQRGGVGDPVQEIVHGVDGPNTVIATALHELLPKDRRKVLAFADSRQEAAFFAWYAQDSYGKVRDRNLLLRALSAGPVDTNGLSIDDLRSRLLRQWEDAGLFRESQTGESKRREVLKAIFREALTDERRLSLAGVGLLTWFICLPLDLPMPDATRKPPWNLTDDEARRLLGYLLDDLRLHRAMSLPDETGALTWADVSPWPQWAYGMGTPGKRRSVSEWGAAQSSVVKHFLSRLLENSGMSASEIRTASIGLMKDLWRAVRQWDSARANREDCLLLPATESGTFRLNSNWLRIKPTERADVWECDICSTVTGHHVRGVCPRNGCPGSLVSADPMHLAKNHYRSLYENPHLPPALSAEEHTAQIDNDEARRRQHDFKTGATNLLSSSTTFEIGVDLGDLDAVFLRNVPPESFNYAQRVGRSGRRDQPGLALTYCRRNPHDLYHYDAPKERVLAGKVHPPRLQLTNTRIIVRHLTASALSAFFRDPRHRPRFDNVATFLGDWSNANAVAELRSFCSDNDALRQFLRSVVPADMRALIGLDDDTWIDSVAGADSRLALAEREVCSDYHSMERHRKEMYAQRKGTNRVEARIKTIANEPTLNFLSRKAVIPKYGFPVDVVELDTRPGDGNPSGVSLQRDLSQAIAEYAPGGKIVANKLEWESRGIKRVPDREWPVRWYQYDDARNFQQWDESDSSAPPNLRKYLSPIFGFVTPLFAKPKEPQRRSQRLYTTRPFFCDFDAGVAPATKNIHGVKVTKTAPGKLVILCEGRNRQGFYICRSCGAHMTKRTASHKSPSDTACRGTLGRFSLGHELVTDVIRLRFPGLVGQWDAYSVAYAVLLGSAETLDVPDTDLNATIAGGDTPNGSSIVLYDNVPGGAALVAQMEHESVFGEMLGHARDRVSGHCGCDSSCYGCLRSYRNQFAHSELDRKRALDVLTRVYEHG